MPARDPPSEAVIVTSCFAPPGSDLFSLCDAWWHAWTAAAPSLGVSVVQVLGSLEDMFDPLRAPHWQKVLLLHALITSAPNQLPSFDLAIFVDSDAMLRRVDADLLGWVSLHMGHRTVMLPTDSWDGLSTGEVFVRRTPEAAAFLLEWYRRAPEHYGRISTGYEVEALRTTHGKLLKAQLTFRTWWERGYRSKSPEMRGMTAWRNHVAKQQGRGWRNSVYPFHKVVAQRCWPWYVTHEQGCLPHVMTTRPEMREQLAIVEASALHNLELGRGGQALFLHVCCRSTARRIEALRICMTRLMENRTDC